MKENCLNKKKKMIVLSLVFVISLVVLTSIGQVGVYAGHDTLSMNSTSTYASHTVTTDDGFVFDIDNQSITGYNGTVMDISIPAEINGKKVLTIESGAFYGMGLKSVVIPEGVTTISDNAFNGCGSLVSVTIPNSIKAIRYSAFEACSSLTSIVIPNSVTTIESFVFASCNQLTNVTFEKRTNEIHLEENVFSNCAQLQEVILPDYLTTISSQLFCDCSSLETIEIPKSVTSISSDAFSGSGLKKIYVFSDLSGEPWGATDPEIIKGIMINEENFPDQNFRQWVMNNTDTNHDNFLSYTEIDQMTEIDVSNLEISNLKGIEYFTAIEGLFCETNQLTELDVSENTKLRWLSCAENQIQKLDFSHNLKLEQLSCIENQLKTIDISQNTALENLYCNNNQLLSIDPRHTQVIDDSGWSDQKRVIEVQSDTYDLKDADSQLNPDFIKNCTGAQFNGTIISHYTLGTPITYDYDFGVAAIDNYPMNVTITLYGKNSWKTPLSIENWRYGETPKGPSVEAMFGQDTLKLTYSDSENGTYTDEAPTQLGTWYVKASIAETANYSGLEAIKSFQIVKGNPTYDVPTDLTAYVGETLSDIQLPKGFEWMNNTTSVGNPGQNTFQVKYIPEDTENYQVVENINVVVNVKAIEVTKGTDLIYQVGNGQDMTVTCSGKLSKLTGIYVDDKLVDEKNYTVKSGSTVLTLKSAYLDKLSAGQHVLKFEYDKVSAEVTFTVTKEEQPLQPEDNQIPVIQPEIPEDEEKVQKPSDDNNHETTNSTSHEDLKSENVKTNDTMTIVPIVALLIVSGIGTIVLLKKIRE